jgi:hypothetical protein
MNHLSEEELILHYYGEEGGAPVAGRHLEECEQCRETYGALERVLNVVDALAAPQRGADYEALLWQRVEARLPRRRSWAGRLADWMMPGSLRLAGATAAFAALLAGAFLAGRFYPPEQPRQEARTIAPDPQAHERILLVAVGDYLERSQMVLVELANARPKGPLDITAERERAADLVSESRLYRQTADHTGDAALASVLDDLDRVLLEISHAPARVSPAGLESLRQRFEAEGILFKIRVLGSNVRNRQKAPPAEGSARRQTL